MLEPLPTAVSARRSLMAFGLVAAVGCGHLAHYPDEELTLIVLTNVENDSAILRACDVAALLFDRRDVTAGSIEDLTPRQRCGLEPRKGTGNRNDREDP